MKRVMHQWRALPFSSLGSARTRLGGIVTVTVWRDTRAYKAVQLTLCTFQTKYLPHTVPTLLGNWIYRFARICNTI